MPTSIYLRCEILARTYTACVIASVFRVPVTQLFCHEMRATIGYVILPLDN